MHQKWTKIQSFHNIRKMMRKRISYAFDMNAPIQTVYRFKGKVKLHGTNAGIHVHGGKVEAQSRSRVITPEDDNHGFARWVYENEEWIRNCTIFEKREDFVIFGEWAGPGIMQATAVNQLKNHIFAIFAIVFPQTDEIMYEPEKIRRFLSIKQEFHPQVHVLPWILGSELIIDFAREDSIDTFVDKSNKMIAEIEAEDPWVKVRFGISGMGEGAVFYPINMEFENYERYKDLIFKAKGEKHQVVQKKKPVEKDPETVSKALDFAKKFVTKARCEQALEEGCGGEIDMKNTGAFLKWIGNDVRSEATDDLENSGLTWKDVAKSVAAVAKEWWMHKVKTC